MKNAKAVRAAFLDYFAKQGHTVVRSSSLVPENDPTLMFTNAGMNQFKDVFTGRESRPYKRAASSQKCVRAGGKHNDLENVGFTARHHTFFEMLGNFSFGDYFKADAIEFAHQLIVKDLGIDPSRLMYTVFGGDKSLPGLPADDEAAALWKKVSGVGDDRVIKLGAKDNFWQMGEVGPMGPCSELHYHQGDDLPCPEPVCLGPACDCDRWLEIWNLVFMQYERKEPGGPLGKLPAPSVDTGAGLERVTAVVNGYRSNYETDLFVPLIARTAELARKKILSDAGDLASLRVIADHARATAFLVADGVQPDKGAREYVLRRIFRRAVRHGRKLGIDQPFMFEVCNAVIELMGDVYPELRERQKVIEKVARDEEIRFRETLDRGLDLLENEFERLKQGGETVVPGAKVFQLHDTFGFPSDLTAVIAAERGFSADTVGFETEMAAAQARSSFRGEGEAVETVYKELSGKLPGTSFLGYDAAENGTFASGKVLALVVDGKPAESATTGQSVRVVLDQTPFYANSGGQIGDTGTLTGKGAEIEIVDTQKPAGELFVLFGTVRAGQVKVGDELEQRVDASRRDMIRANHSATHLLHHALHQVIGEHATQKGSLVGPDRLRFDFSHGAPLTTDEKQRVEDLVNAEIRKNLDTRTEVLPIEQARARGAMSMFGDKYGDKVRVVGIGGESLEFCGGTHVRRAGDIGLFKILGEAGVAQGVRRLEAATGAGALEYVRRMESELARASERLKGGAFEVAARVERLADSLKARDKEIDELKKKLATGGGRDLMSDVRDVGGIKVLAQKTEVADAKALRDVGDQLRDKLGSGVVVLFGVADGKVSLLTMVSKDLVGKLHAGKLAGELAAMVGGKGGGRPDMAQAGGTDPSKVDAAIARAFELVAAGS
jgi:alanyl-tRNA synthetase